MAESETGQPAPFTPEEMNASAAVEQAELMEAQLEHLKQRVVLLHANLLRAQTENAALVEELNRVKQDKKKPAPRQAKKKGS